ncbi:MAG: hypothetical protein ACE5IB_03020 [Candidatus Geothermarchaeales archaeon]
MRQIQVVKTDSVAKMDRQLRSQIKDLGMSRRASFMKKERLQCPMLSEEITPLTCLVCPHFRRRVMGFVHCNYPSGGAKLPLPGTT